jgi:hypothetical protein
MGVLRNNSRRCRRWSRLGRSKWSPHSHDKYTNHGWRKYIFDLSNLTLVFERRYPVILREFSLRAGSGGKGKYHGGDGVVRDIEFRIPCQVSILSERRVYRPYGLHGGEDAEYDSLNC